MVERAWDTNSKQTVSAYSAFQSDRTDIYHYQCYDLLCHVPLTLVNRNNERFYFMASKRDQPHQEGCIALIEEKEEQASRADNNNADELQKLKDSGQPLYAIDIGPRINRSSAKNTAASRQNTKSVIVHKRITSFATLVDLLHNKEISRSFQIPVSIRYDKADRIKKQSISGRSGTRRVGDLVNWVRKNMVNEPKVNRFYYFGGIARVTKFNKGGNDSYRIEYINKTPNGRKIICFINKPSNYKHSPWWQNLELLAEHQNEYYGFVYAAGHLYEHEFGGELQYQLFPQVQDPLRNFYVPNWGVKKYSRK
ncbi:hypothetical protein GHU05_02450 [Fructobacillus tropaeoli]|uniref:hypothetical protein n=1 Tax=Fructobacillus tropaeoli TaxID=709323 RepID=UPI0014560EC4|nr:hypothetical protein [Fructobacillus tropaeoli]NLS37794.1 hypothetical protein [Fructobacillus tropaeoli]